MRKIVLIALLLFSFINGFAEELELDERKTDLFYANGVWAADSKIGVR